METHRANLHWTNRNLNSVNKQNKQTITQKKQFWVYRLLV